MPPRLTWFFALIAVVLAFAALDDARAQDVPPDFAVEYQWSTGSIPAPGHMEYYITAAGSGRSGVLMAPGGIARLDVSLSRLRAIYIVAKRFRNAYEAEQDAHEWARRIITLGCFPSHSPPLPGSRCAAGLQPPRSLRVGGAFCGITISPERKGEELPCVDDDGALSPGLKPMKDDLVKSLRDLVQQRTWNCLYRNRGRYELDWQRIFRKQGGAAANRLAIMRHDPEQEVCR